MSAKHSRRTFTACWTCRQRRIRCDGHLPQCSRCSKQSIHCEGYQVKLAWVNADTGAYDHSKRRALQCGLTWSGWPIFESNEVDQLIAECDIQDRDLSQSVDSPFAVFSLHGKVKDKGAKAPISTLEDFRSIDSFILDAAQRPRSSYQTSPSFLSPIYKETGGPQEKLLFNHYVTHVSRLMIAVEDLRNPWKSTYPAIALQGRTLSTSALYNAQLAKAALNLSNLTNDANNMRTQGIRYYGRALQDLRKSFVSSECDYESRVASLMTLVMSEAVYAGKSSSWRVHFQALSDFCRQNIHEQPWHQSHDAWVITQSFIHTSIIGRTATVPGTSNLSGFDHREIFESVAEHGMFGFTAGNTRSIINNILEIQFLGERLARGIGDDFNNQVISLIQAVQDPLNKEDTICRDYLPAEDSVSEQSFRKIKHLSWLHLRMFKTASFIYFHRTVFNTRPAALAHYVSAVLEAAMEYIKIDGGTVSVWPVFIAAVEAYTEMDRAMATEWLGFAMKQGIGNRFKIKTLVETVWRQRERYAHEKNLCPGVVTVDWKEEMRRLDLDVLLI